MKLTDGELKELILLEEISNIDKCPIVNIEEEHFLVTTKLKNIFLLNQKFLNKYYLKSIIRKVDEIDYIDGITIEAIHK